MKLFTCLCSVNLKWISIALSRKNFINKITVTVTVLRFYH